MRLINRLKLSTIDISGLFLLLNGYIWVRVLKKRFHVIAELVKAKLSYFKDAITLFKFAICLIWDIMHLWIGPSCTQPSRPSAADIPTNTRAHTHIYTQTQATHVCCTFMGNNYSAKTCRAHMMWQKRLSLKNSRDVE